MAHRLREIVRFPIPFWVVSLTVEAKHDAVTGAMAGDTESLDGH